MIKIGVLANSLVLKRWQNEILDYIDAHPNLELTALVLKKKEKEISYSSQSSFFYRFSQALDRRIFSTKNEAFELRDVSSDYKSIPVISVSGIKKGFSYYLPEDKVKEIKALSLDVLIRFGFGILKGDILNAARFGVWSLHHGDNAINRGGPPAFWEVANKEEVTGITLQKLSEDLDGGQVIKKSYIKTDNTSFYRNKNQAFWAGVELFNLALDELGKGNLTLPEDEEKPCLGIYSHPLYRDPDNLRSLKIMTKFWFRRIKENFKEKINNPQWYLLYRFRVDDKIEKSLFRYKALYPPKGYDWADPFIIKKEKHFFVFFEELQMSTKKAHISYLEFDGNGRLVTVQPVKVLEESYHLSYPYIFEEEGDFYLIPESADVGELWLYKAENFPKKWKRYQCIFQNKAIYDASLFYHNDFWYLLGTEKLSEGGNRDQYLHIYYSKDLVNSEWVSHPQNPVSLDVRGARPAGKIFKKNGKIYRASQIGAPKYGYGIQLNEIEVLSPSEFSETKVEEILPKWKNKLLATHTFNFVDGFTIIDAQGKI